MGQRTNAKKEKRKQRDRCINLTGSSMTAMAMQILSRATLAPTAEATGAVAAGPRKSRI